ncbi:MAG: glycosyltransferase, partial [Alphaproteobacteria bacterium]
MPRERVVLCMKWGTLFPSDYVNVLFRAVSANLAPGFRFVCMTDRTEGLDPGITTVPIPDIGLTPGQIRAPGVWRKLALFHPDVAELSPGARALVIDLDMV